MHFSEHELEQIRKTLNERKAHIDRLILELRQESADLEMILGKMDAQMCEQETFEHFKSEIDHFVNQMFGRHN
ncbi:hypothetical protein SAMN05444392_103258 [Seinonella peptonophila]|uniref:Uncharacterized protein n=1 Tax=Seinonella peptonophila TaxID=112248 RepID=A0A1M4WJY8_9BACL|nr:hypothetical protein [Seinonella peptonophila]SHE81611.1 hypothetical protein SAMN05444392_103258 [Seinonella peptonophila]